MNLISCPTCGVVLDKDKIIFPEIWDDEGAIIDGTAVWDGDGFVPITNCPVCKGEILDDNPH